MPRKKQKLDTEQEIEQNFEETNSENETDEFETYFALIKTAINKACKKGKIAQEKVSEIIAKFQIKNDDMTDKLMEASQEYLVENDLLEQEDTDLENDYSDFNDDFGDEYYPIISNIYNVSALKDRKLEFWLEYIKDPGIEIKLLTTGIKRQKKTVLLPFVSNQ